MDTKIPNLSISPEVDVQKELKNSKNKDKRKYEGISNSTFVDGSQTNNYGNTSNISGDQTMINGGQTVINGNQTIVNGNQIILNGNVNLNIDKTQIATIFESLMKNNSSNKKGQDTDGIIRYIRKDGIEDIIPSYKKLGHDLNLLDELCNKLETISNVCGAYGYIDWESFNKVRDYVKSFDYGNNNKFNYVSFDKYHNELIQYFSSLYNALETTTKDNLVENQFIDSVQVLFVNLDKLIYEVRYIIQNEKKTYNLI